MTLSGLDGEANEAEDQTRSKCVALARNCLRIADAAPTDFSACHRLKSEANAGIIVRFKDLQTRNRWLENAKNLKNSMQSAVGISPDLPPVIRPLKSELLNVRRQMPAESKSRCNIRYLRHWPYIELRRPNGDPIRPDESSLKTVAKTILGFPALLQMTPPSS